MDGPTLISISDLNPGDVLLFSTPRKPTSKAIQIVLASNYNHAAIYLGGDRIAEASAVSGVRTSPLHVPPTGHIAVFRSQLGFGAERAMLL